MSYLTKFCTLTLRDNKTNTLKNLNNDFANTVKEINFNVYVPQHIPANSGFEAYIENWPYRVPSVITIRDNNFGHAFVIGNWWVSSNKLTLQVFHVNNSNWNTSDSNPKIILCTIFQNN